LTENPDFSVLVLEAGVSSVIHWISQHFFIMVRRNEGVLDSMIPFWKFGGNLLGPTIYDWSTTMPFSLPTDR
jgi:hypothetical protein